MNSPCMCCQRLCFCDFLQEIALFLRVLGTYPMDTELGFTSSDDELLASPAISM